MAEEGEFIPHIISLGEGSRGSKPNEHNVETQSLTVAPQNQDVRSELVCDLGYPMMQFVVQNFNQINAMYLAFSSRKIGVYPKHPISDSSNDHPVIESWHPISDLFVNKNMFDAKKILEKLRDKKILFVGDSLNRNQFVSMVCMLQTIIPNEQKSLLKVPNQPLLVTFQEYNVSIDFYWAPLLVESNADNPTKHKTHGRIIRIDSIGKHAEHWVDADVLVFNSYNWWRWPTFNISNGSFEDSKQYKLVDNHYGYNVALEQWSTWFYSHVNHTRTKSYFMTMTAVHKRGEEWGRKVGTNCFNETEPILNDGFWESGCDPEMMRILESSLNKLNAKGVNVQMVNISQLTQYRRDGHPSIYRKHYSPMTATQLSNPIIYADCSHWCVPGVPDTWNELLLAQILRGQL